MSLVQEYEHDNPSVSVKISSEKNGWVYKIKEHFFQAIYYPHL